MKTKDLHIPFDWENRQPVIVNRLLYVPAYFTEHKKFDEKITFEKKQPLNIEYCSGNGQWIIDKAKSHPDINWIAVEMDFQRARKIWVKMHNENLNNLFVVMGEAKTFTKYYLLKESIDNIFINFPDPWPKKKHAKNRLLKKDFLTEVSRVLKQDHEITVVTDDTVYSKQAIDTFVEHKDYQNIYPSPYYVNELIDYGASYFNDLFVSQKKDIFYIKFKKQI